MKFAIQINASPYQGEAATSAFHFVRAALALGHEVFRVFFYYEGSYNAFGDARPPADECAPVRRWSELASTHGVDLVVCVSAAQRRGLLSEQEGGRLGRETTALADGFRISGLGQLAEAAIGCDRFIVFGG